jgi:hypothetical protein
MGMLPAMRTSMGRPWGCVMTATFRSVNSIVRSPSGRNSSTMVTTPSASAVSWISMTSPRGSPSALSSPAPPRPDARKFHWPAASRRRVICGRSMCMRLTTTCMRRSGVDRRTRSNRFAWMKICAVSGSRMTTCESVRCGRGKNSRVASPTSIFRPRLVSTCWMMSDLRRSGSDNRGNRRTRSPATTTSARPIPNVLGRTVTPPYLISCARRIVRQYESSPHLTKRRRGKLGSPGRLQRGGES